MRRLRSIFLFAGLLLGTHLCSPPTLGEAKPFLLHLPGIGGHMFIDDLMTGGLRDGGLDAEIQIYDWTEGQSGLPALAAWQRNQLQARKIADLITQVHRADPARRIIITGHSAGCGLAVWAMENLPEDIRVDTLLMLAPALSPQYDLSKSLARVKNAYAFISEFDLILGPGTRQFGTIDRVKSDAAGRVGFSRQYPHLVVFPYDSAWLRWGNFGDHIGAMSKPFARNVLAPLLIAGTMPATQPTTTQAR